MHVPMNGLRKKYCHLIGIVEEKQKMYNYLIW